MFDFFSVFIFCVDCEIPIAKKTKRGVVDLRDTFNALGLSDGSSDGHRIVCRSCYEIALQRNAGDSHERQTR